MFQIGKLAKNKLTNIYSNAIQNSNCHTTTCCDYSMNQFNKKIISYDDSKNNLSINPQIDKNLLYIEDSNILNASIDGGKIGETDRVELAKITKGDINTLVSKSIKSNNLRVCNKITTCDILPSVDAITANGTCDLGSKTKWFNSIYVKGINTTSETVSFWDGPTLVGETKLTLDSESGNTTFNILGEKGNNAVKFGNDVVITGKLDAGATSELLVTDYKNCSNTVKFCVQDYNRDCTKDDLRRICIGDNKIEFHRKISGVVDASTIGYSSGLFTIRSTSGGNANLRIEGDLIVTGSVTASGDDGILESTSTHIYAINTSKSFVIGSTSLISGSNKLEVVGNAKITQTLTANEVKTDSDEKLKKNIKKIQTPIEKLKKIKGVSFNWKKNNEGSYGVIAQDIKPILPDAVYDNDGTKSVNYNSIIALLVETCKSQQKMIETQKEMINSLKDRVNKLENQIL